MLYFLSARKFGHIKAFGHMKAGGESPRCGLVFVGQKDCRHRAIRLSNNPELHTVSVFVDREEAKLLIDRFVVGLPIFRVALSPVTSAMPSQSSKPFPR